MAPILFAALVAGLAACSPAAARAPASLGFWFEPVSFASPALGGAVTPEDLTRIEQVARAEIAAAFTNLHVTVTDRREARYRIRVVQDVLDERHRFRKMSVAGESRGSRQYGGAGTVNFSYFAGGALVFAPAGTTRPALIEAIGRGVGRGAVHEFTHLLLPDAPVHSRNRTSYEYYAASRPEQYFGPMGWDLAAPLLAARFGRE